MGDSAIAGGDDCNVEYLNVSHLQNSAMVKSTLVMVNYQQMKSIMMGMDMWNVPLTTAAGMVK